MTKRDLVVKIATETNLTQSDVAAVSLVGEEWQWFKAGVGLEAVHIPLSLSFCAHGIETGTTYEVADATADVRFAQHPLVNRDGGLRSYAGHPIEFEGEQLGMLFVMSAQPRTLTPEQMRWLQDLAQGAADAAASHERIFKLQISQRRLLDFASASSDWLWETDSSHHYTWLSDRFEDLTGLTVQSQLGRNPPASPMRDGAGRVVEPLLGFLEVLDRQQSFARVVVLKPTPMGDRLISYSAIAKFGSDGMFRGYRGSAQDVTHRIGAERQEREVSDTLRLLAQHVPGVLYQRVSRPDGTGYCPYASESVRQLFEITPEKLALDSGPMFDRIHPEDRKSVEAQIRSAENSGQPWSQTFRVVLPEAGLRVLSGFASPRRMPDGNVLWHGFTTDVTESEKAAAEIARSGQQWELASQAAGIGIFELNLSTATITLDRNACQVHHLPAESPTAFVLAQWLDMLEPSARESAQAFISLAAVSGVIQREGRKLMNAMVRRQDARSVATVDASLAALGSQTIVGLNWSAVVTGGASQSNASAWPAADFAKVQLVADQQELGVEIDTWIMNPAQLAQLRLVYGSDYASVLASYGISVAASNRVVVGTAYALAAGMVGEIRAEKMLTTETWREPETQKTWVQTDARFTQYVTDPYSVFKVTGLAG